MSTDRARAVSFANGKYKILFLPGQGVLLLTSDNDDVIIGMWRWCDCNLWLGQSRLMSRVLE